MIRKPGHLNNLHYCWMMFSFLLNCTLLPKRQWLSIKAIMSEKYPSIMNKVIDFSTHSQTLLVFHVWRVQRNCTDFCFLKKVAITSVIVEGLSFSVVELWGKDWHPPSSSSSLSSMSSVSSSIALKSIPSKIANFAMFVAVTSLK